MILLDFQDNLVCKIMLMMWCFVCCCFQSVSNIQPLDSSREPIPGSESGTKSTLNDLLETLKKLEEDEHLETPRPEKKNAWCKNIYIILKTFRIRVQKFLAIYFTEQIRLFHINYYPLENIGLLRLACRSHGTTCVISIS